MKIGLKVKFRRPYENHTDLETTYEVKKYMPGGEKASDVFNQPMVVLNGINEWLPAWAIKEVE